jgi:hypothetical protein
VPCDEDGVGGDERPRSEWRAIGRDADDGGIGTTVVDPGRRRHDVSAGGVGRNVYGRFAGASHGEHDPREE